MVLVDFFHHTPLKSSNSIRLLTLHPGEPDEDIRCSISEHGPDSRPPYRALSYMWGDPPENSIIWINGRCLLIRQNLWTCLWYLRLNNGVENTSDVSLAPMFFWIDAICIHQENVQERNAQVKRMAKIYRAAEGVIAWLGLNDDDSDRAFNLLGEALRSVKEAIYATKFGHWEDKYAQLVLRCDGEWQSCIRFCKRPYWKRTWILQEVIQAKDVTLMCGPRALSWTAFKNIEALKLIYRQLGTGQESGHGTWRVFERVRNQPRISSLRAAVYYFAGNDYSDPRDKLYGLLGLADDCSPVYDEQGRLVDGIEVDYAKQPIEVFADCVRFFHNPLVHSGWLPTEEEKSLQQNMGISDKQIKNFKRCLPTFDIPSPFVSRPSGSRLKPGSRTRLQAPRRMPSKVTKKKEGRGGGVGFSEPEPWPFSDSKTTPDGP